MKINLATKRNASGWRKILLIDTETKQYSRESTHWFCREDFAEVSISDFQRTLEKVEKEGYNEVERMTP
jgi:hypothetical protein